MPKHKNRSPRSRSASLSRRSKRKHRHSSPRYESRSKLACRRAASRRSLSHSRSPRSLSPAQDGLWNMLCEFTDFLRRRGVPVLGEAPVDTQRPASLALSEGTTTPDRPGEASIASEKQIDEQTALRGRGGEPGMSPSNRRYCGHP